MKQLQNLYFDMDGVLADFNAEPNGVERFRTEKDFFYKLKPLTKNVRAVKRAVKHGHNVFILSASPNENADNDKRKWLAKYLPVVKKENIIIMRNGQNKADFIKTNDGILLDDYGKNCQQWCERGRVALQVRVDGDIDYYLKTLEKI